MTIEISYMVYLPVCTLNPPSLHFSTQTQRLQVHHYNVMDRNFSGCSPSLSIVCTYALSDVQDEPLRRSIVWPLLFAAFFLLSSLVLDVSSTQSTPTGRMGMRNPIESSTIPVSTRPNVQEDTSQYPWQVQLQATQEV